MKMQRSFELTIYAVGNSPEKAIKNLGKTLRWGKIENLQPQTADRPCDWYYRFTADNGTSMKAAGEYVTGGVILTWWK